MDIEEKDYYAVLGLQKDASKDEIKKAFKKLAIVYHPDKNGGSDTKFKEISEAYGILTDDEKKEIYDQYGCRGLKEYENHPMRNVPVRLQPLVSEVVCNLAELYNGTQKEITVERTILEGNIKNPQKLQKSHEEETFTVDIEPFTLYGQKIVHPGKGHRHKVDDLVGDLIFIIVPKAQENDDEEQFLPQKQDNEEEYKGYTLDGLDLRYKLKISLAQALLGFKTTIEFLDGKLGSISSAQITHPSTIKVIPNKGFKKDIKTPIGVIKKQGHLYIHFEIEFPEKLTAKQTKCLAMALGVPKVDETQLDKVDDELVFKVEHLEDPAAYEQNEGPQTIFIGPGGMPGMMPGMGGMPGMPGMGGMPGEGQECSIM